VTCSLGAGVGVDGVDTAAACLRVLTPDMFLIADCSQYVESRVCSCDSGYLADFNLFADEFVKCFSFRDGRIDIRK
jgi:hypothetical protein